MNRIETLNRRYILAANLAQNGVEIVTVGDIAGARLNSAVRKLTQFVKEEGGTYFDDLLGAARALRWRRITQPQPIEFNPSLSELTSEVVKHAHQLRGAIADKDFLDELVASAELMSQTDPPAGEVLLESLTEAGIDACVVVAANKYSATGLHSWLAGAGVLVLTAGELSRLQPELEQSYVVGPPRFYHSSLVTSPVTEAISFLFPSWFRDLSVPQSPLAPYADGAIHMKPRVFVVGAPEERVNDPVDDGKDEAEYLPQPLWGSTQQPSREPASEEALAHKLLLSGNLAMWLDDGDRIRSLDPDQPVGERVTYTDIRAVQPGTILLLRRGETERSVLFSAALDRLPRGQEVRLTQASWKRLLAEQIRERGYRRVVDQLRIVGVKACDRAHAWTDPLLIRPMSDEDFEKLLHWLHVPVNPTFRNATDLRRTIHQVSAEIGRQLEKAVSAADLAELDLYGHLGLEVEAEGFRGIIATRVLAISPSPTLVSRHETRVPFEDRSGQWLE